MPKLAIDDEHRNLVEVLLDYTMNYLHNQQRYMMSNISAFDIFHEFRDISDILSKVIKKNSLFLNI